MLFHYIPLLRKYIKKPINGGMLCLIKQENGYTCYSQLMKTSKENQSSKQEATWLKEYYETGSLEVLGKLYEPYMFLIFGLCLKYLKDSTKSEDAVMQIFESLIKKLRVHRVENFKAWLYTVARN